MVLGLVTAGSTGAFDQVTLERPLLVDTGADADGFLQLRPHPDRDHVTGLGVENRTDGTIAVNLTRAKLNKNASTEFLDLIEVTNQGTKQVDFSVEAVDETDNPIEAVTVFESDSPHYQPSTLVNSTSISLGILFETNKGPIPENLLLKFDAETP